MLDVLNHRSQAAQSIGTGFFARLRGWFEARRHNRSVTMNDLREEAGSSAKLLAFPTRGEALLVRMAERLRQSVGDRKWAQDPLILVLSRRQH